MKETKTIFKKMPVELGDTFHEKKSNALGPSGGRGGGGGLRPLSTGTE